MAVNVDEPAVLGVIEKVLVPATSAALAGQGRVGVGGGDADRVGRADEVPVGVDRVDGDLEGAAGGLRARVRRSCRRRCRVPRSRPACSIWSLVKAPALIVVAGLVLAVIAPLVMSVAVKVALPAVFEVTERVFVPATSAALAGSVAFASLEVIADGVGRGDEVPVGVDRVDDDVERGAGGLGRRGAGLAGGGAGGGGLAGHQDLQLGEGAGVDRLAGLVLAVIAPLVTSEAVNVEEAAVFG